MKKFEVFLIAAIGLILASSSFAKAQYEQKFTLQLSGGASFIVSSYPVTPEHFLTEEIYDVGMLLNGGLQYNFNRKFSLIGLAMYGAYPTTSESLQDGKYFYLGLGVSAKYRFFPLSRVKPYLLGGFSVCFVEQSISVNMGEEVNYKQPTLPGLVSGVGLEIDLTDNFTLFMQSGFNKLLPKENDDLPPTESVYVLLGLNINVLKSKSL